MHVSFRLYAALGSLLLLAAGVESATVTVTPATKYQTIIGFGAGSVYYNNWVTAHKNKAAIYDTMFTGLGLSLMRMGNWNQDTTATLAIDSEIVAEGKKRMGSRLKIFMSSWSAPKFLKANDSINGGGFTEAQNTLLKENGAYVYAKFAHWWRRSIEKYQAKGMGPDFMSLQNEPDMNATYESTIFTKTEGASAGYPQALLAVADTIAKMTTKPVVYGPEPLGIGYGNYQGYMNGLNAAKLGGYAYHLYHGNTNDSKYDDPDGFNTILTTLSTTYTGKPFIMTEFCSMRSDIYSSDMLTVARLILNLLTSGNASGYINWNLYWGTSGQMIGVENPWTSSSWTTTNGYIIEPEYHGMRHFSKFVAPGWQRVAISSDNASIKAGAFMNTAADSMTIVALNLSSGNLAMTAAPSGFTVKEAWQSQVSGTMSNKLTLTTGQSSFSLLDSSVTTLVFAKATSSSSAAVSSSALVSSSSAAKSSSSVAVSSSGAVNVVWNASEQPVTSYQVLDLLGRPVQVYSSQPTRLPAGRWIVVARNAQGEKLASWVQDGLQ